LIAIEGGLFADRFYIHSKTALAEVFTDEGGDLDGGACFGGIGNQDFLAHGVLFSEGSIDHFKFGVQGGEVAKSTAGEGRSAKRDACGLQKVTAGEFFLGHGFHLIYG